MRKVASVTEQLCGLEVSKSQASEPASKVDAEIAPWRGRRFGKPYPYRVVDARYEKVRRGGAILRQAVLFVVGTGAVGYCEALGCWVLDAEPEANGGTVFSELKERGLSGGRCGAEGQSAQSAASGAILGRARRRDACGLRTAGEGSPADARGRPAAAPESGDATAHARGASFSRRPRGFAAGLGAADGVQIRRGTERKYLNMGAARLDAR